MSAQVFLSVGRLATTRHRKFVHELEAKLRILAIEPHTIGRNTFTAGQPLEKIKDEMRLSRGLIVVATERTHFPTGGEEYRSLDKPPTQIGARRYATAWHHIELAMACMLGLPTFVIIEEGIFEEGLLEDKYGWYVYRTTIETSVIDSDEFNGILGDWCQRVKTTPPLPTTTMTTGVGELTVGQLFTALKPSAIWTLLGSLATILGGAFAGGTWLASKGFIVDPKVAPVVPSVNASTAPSGSPPPLPSPEPSTPAQVVVDAFLKAIDSGDPLDSWALLSDVTRKEQSMTESTWREIYSNTILPLGKLKSRSLIGQGPFPAPPAAPPGLYRYLAYQSSHAKETGRRIETVTVRSDSGVWQIFNYQISPKQP